MPAHTKKKIARNIRKEVRAGTKPKKAVAIAFSKARKQRSSRRK